MSRKKLNVDGVTNELKDGSLFFANQDNSETAEARTSGKSEIQDTGAPKIRSLGVKVKDDMPYKKETFLVTEGEYEGMEDLKTQLRRRYDLRATKNDILRCALQLLLENYEGGPEESRIVMFVREKERR
ncbi:MAG: hypothetical protein M3Q29_13885 [Chloroflexota bacterium]|nr:hypothetical protein [Chloroflexota bacterium]